MLLPFLSATSRAFLSNYAPAKGHGMWGILG